MGWTRNTLIVTASAVCLALLTPRAWTGPASRFEESEVRVLVRMVADEKADFATRAEACRKLVPFGPKARSAVPDLLKLVLDTRTKLVPTGGDRWKPDRWGDAVLGMRGAAVEALKAIRPEAGAFSSLVKALRGLPGNYNSLEGLPGPGWDERGNQFAAFATGLVELLGEAGPQAREAVPVLLEVLEGQIVGKKVQDKPLTFSYNQQQQVAAVRALGRIGVQDTAVIDALLKAKNFGVPTVRQAAEQLLEEWKDGKPASRNKEPPTPPAPGNGPSGQGEIGSNEGSSGHSWEAIGALAGVGSVVVAVFALLRKKGSV